MTEDQWRARWDAGRMFMTADGESGKTGGNETIRVDETGKLRIKVPTALAPGTGRISLLRHRWGFRTVAPSGRERVAGRRAVRYDITYNPAKIAGIWTRPGNRTYSQGTLDRRLRIGPVLGVDLNADHLACSVLDGQVTRSATR